MADRRCGCRTAPLSSGAHRAGADRRTERERRQLMRTVRLSTCRVTHRCLKRPKALAEAAGVAGGVAADEPHDVGVRDGKCALGGGPDHVRDGGCLVEHQDPLARVVQAGEGLHLLGRPGDRIHPPPPLVLPVAGADRRGRHGEPLPPEHHASAGGSARARSWWQAGSPCSPSRRLGHVTSDQRITRMTRADLPTPCPMRWRPGWLATETGWPRRWPGAPPAITSRASWHPRARCRAHLGGKASRKTRSRRCDRVPCPLGRRPDGPVHPGVSASRRIGPSQVGRGGEGLRPRWDD